MTYARYHDVSVSRVWLPCGSCELRLFVGRHHRAVCVLCGVFYLPWLGVATLVSSPISRRALPRRGGRRSSRSTGVSPWAAGTRMGHYAERTGLTSFDLYALQYDAQSPDIQNLMGVLWAHVYT